ncbi:MAG: class I SAM-dependent methyltransferase [Nanoarchaeota archaeon]|nr:class I SAM-dependent methyltransferase [Nanoarchaeota archaeon]
MYPKSKVGYWKERSLSSEYQEAYDNIIKNIPESGSTLLDVGCGTGEILKRVWKELDYGLLIGCDATYEMLKGAMEKLKSENIPARIERKWDLKLLNSKEVVLLLEDVSDMQIPKQIADTALFTFPEIFSNSKKWAGEGKIKNEIRKRGYEFNDIKKIIKKLMIHRNIADKIKNNGRFISVEYDVQYRNSFLESRVIYNKISFAEMISLRLENAQFFESAKVWSDTEGKLEDFIEEKPGYRIFSMSRVE